MKFTDKHIECAKVCARLEIAGQNTKEMALECGVALSTFYKWLKNEAFLAEKARCKAFFRVDLSDIPITHRRDRIEVSAAIANDEDEKSDTRLRAIKANLGRDGGRRRGDGREPPGADRPSHAKAEGAGCTK